jgi:hypothetical protein
LPRLPDLEFAIYEEARPDNAAAALPAALLALAQGPSRPRCKMTRITGVENPVHLVASHCKPWRDSTNDERLNGGNGLLLTPSIDHLFDRGFIGFEDNGKLIISPVAHRPSLQRMGIDT